MSDQTPAPQPAPVTVVNVNNAAPSRGVNHPLHAILTLITCGAWAPVWLIVWLAKRG